MRKTPWYPPGIKPVRKGNYEASADKFPGYLYFWDNRNWYFVEGGHLCMEQEKHWRGLAEAPDDAKERQNG